MPLNFSHHSSFFSSVLKNSRCIRVFSVDEAGVIDSSGVAPFWTSGNPVEKCIDWSPDGSQFVFAADDGGINRIQICDFDDTPGSETFTSNTEKIFSDGDVRDLDWNMTYSRFIAVAKYNCTTEDEISVFQHEKSTNNLIELTSLTYSVGSYSVRWGYNGLAIGVGLQGVGDDSEFKVYSFDPNDYSFSLISEYETGGKSVNSIAWGPNDLYVTICRSIGQINLFETSYKSCILKSSFSDIELSLKSNLLFGDCCIMFSGQTVINGKNNFLSLGPSCKIMVDSNSSLEFRDLTLKGIRNGGFYCIDDSATFSFNNVEICLDNDYTFSLGKIDILADLAISGENHKFIYQSSEASSIGSYSKLFLDSGVTFSYDPPTSSRDLLQFADATSQLYLNGATLHSTATGLILSNGTLFLDGEPLFSSEGSVEAEAIVVASDMSVEWSPAALFDFEGPVVWQ